MKVKVVRTRRSDSQQETGSEERLRPCVTLEHGCAQVRAIVARATARLPSVAELPLCCVYNNTISPYLVK